MSTDRLLDLSQRLLTAYGPQGWWPADDPFHVILGAILVQRVTWEGAAKAIARLEASGLSDPMRLRAASDETIVECLRPAGFYRNKTRALRAFLAMLERRHGGDLDRLLHSPTADLRSDLLAVRGIGPETADAILLYAAGRPLFVVDQSARRLLSRLGWIEGDEPYDLLQRRLHAELPRDVRLFSEMHALFVRHGKEHCRARPICGGCPVRSLCPH